MLQETLVDGVQADDEEAVHRVPSWSITASLRSTPSLSPVISSVRVAPTGVDVEKTDADGTGARPPHRLLVSLRVPREHVGSW
jgi:hypothetical protein